LLAPRREKRCFLSLSGAEGTVREKKKALFRHHRQNLVLKVRCPRKGGGPFLKKGKEVLKKTSEALASNACSNLGEKPSLFLLRIAEGKREKEAGGVYPSTTLGDRHEKEATPPPAGENQKGPSKPTGCSRRPRKVFFPPKEEVLSVGKELFF